MTQYSNEWLWVEWKRRATARATQSMLSRSCCCWSSRSGAVLRQGQQCWARYSFRLVARGGIGGDIDSAGGAECTRLFGRHEIGRGRTLEELCRLDVLRLACQHQRNVALLPDAARMCTRAHTVGACKAGQLPSAREPWLGQPRRAAAMRARSRTLSLVAASAPASSRCATITSWPWCAAMWSGV